MRRLILTLTGVTVLLGVSAPAVATESTELVERKQAVAAQVPDFSDRAARGYPSHVKWVYDHGGKPFVETFADNGEMTAYSHATGLELPKVPVTTAYPQIGEYWDFLRWRNASNGHPYVCVEEFPDIGDVNSEHPIATVSKKWDIADFHVVWHDEIVVGYQNCAEFSDQYKITVALGYDTKGCNYNYIAPAPGNPFVVGRMIHYFSETASGGHCWDDPETHVWRTTTGFGTALGMEWHWGSGAPSPYASFYYIWPQTYDFRTLAYYNGPSEWWWAIVLCVAGWFVGRNARKPRVMGVG